MPIEAINRSIILTDKVKGWTTIEGDGNIDPAFSPTFRNIILTQQGKIQKRSGSTAINASATDAPIVSILEWCPTTAGTACQILVTTSAGTIYRLETDNTFTSLKVGRDGAREFGANFRGKLYFNNGVDTPQVYDSAGGLADHTASGATAIAKYGYIHAHESRLFVSGGTDLTVSEIRYGTLNDADDWDTGTTATDAGTIDTAGVLPKGDAVTSINSHKGWLALFHKNHVVLYNFTTDQRSLTLQHIIPQQGTVCADGQELIGNDAYYWARYGVKSVRETVQTESVELGDDISEPIDDELTSRLGSVISNSREDKVSLVNYNPKSILVLNYPVNAAGTEFRQAVYNYRFGAWMEWTGMNHNVIFVSSNNVMYGGDQSGFLHQIDASGATTDNGNSIEFVWETPWLFLGNTARIKDMDALKIVLGVDEADSVAISFRSYTSFNESGDTEITDTFTFTGSGPYWTESAASPTFVFDGFWTGSGKSSPLPFPVTGYGLVHKFFFENSDNQPFSFEYMRADFTNGGKADGQ